MISYNGIGIAAPQIGVSKQICIISISADNPRYGKLMPFAKTIIINPKLTVLDESLQGFW